MAKSIDLTNIRFGRLVALERLNPIKPRDGYRWLCICDCGHTCIRRTRTLRYDDNVIKSCGCYVSDLNKQKPKIRPSTNIKHGANLRGRTAEYVTWSSMIQRCTNNKNVSYPLYGGRGINVCDPWLQSFECFLNDMGKKPSHKHSIDRINNDLGYFKENCKWSTQKEQSKNQRRSVLILINSEKLTAEEARIKYGVPERTLYRWAKDSNGADLYFKVVERKMRNL